jgi:NosR/NirI family nitrous oxide reductase transcriptional regulator
MQVRLPVAWCVVVLIVLLFCGVGSERARAQSRLAEFLAAVPAAELVPGADRYGPVQGTPPFAAVMAGPQVVAHAFVNADWVDSTGYSGKPIQILEALGTDGKIAGARLMDHHEPIVLVGIPPARIAAFIQGYVGRDVRKEVREAGGGLPDVAIVSGATVTVTVIAESMIRAGIRVARTLSGTPAAAAVSQARVIDPAHAAPDTWAGLLAEGSVRRLSLTVGEVNDAFARSGASEAAQHPESADPRSTFIDLYVAPVSVPAIGKALLGETGFAAFEKTLRPGQQAILVAGNGLFSFKGSGYVRGGIFDRIEVAQGDATIHFRDQTHTRIADLAAPGAPQFRDVDIFGVPADAVLDPTQPWRLKLLVQRAWGARDKAFLTFDVSYELPQTYLKPAPAPAAATATSPEQPAAAGAEESGPPLWQAMWRAKAGQIAVLLVALALLTVIFFFQDWLARRPVLYDRVRLAFLTFTLVWLGWYAQAQLSVVNVLAFVSALRSDFRWDYFMMAPLIFILWFATAASMLFWNRGAFCGWLCPFGALQELINRGARLLKIKQIRVPFGVHSRLVALKYIIFLVLFGISLSALATAEQAAEVEPFKTAIILRFARGWPFLLYVGVILASSVVIERSFCRYLCPLGAALAIPARLRMFEWLRRYRECGNPCQRCGNECPVQAIHPEGHINPNECIQCLHCQMLYHHDRLCPVMIQRRLKRERYAGSEPPPALPPRPKVSAQRAGEAAP